ncbi:hypothetical protein POM88_036660 [Heracleum sosnowskyi]|uniref:Uncharacterized protein n=1 Tax=Heracleum sosnowskyi TaxID=360622 RepID=A0AAD8HPM5_9APIA|nr:hypothetical protein POM88_036660 [Heracleum sosnowskyi]
MLLYRPQRKSRLGLDTVAEAKRGEKAEADLSKKRRDYREDSRNDGRQVDSYKKGYYRSDKHYNNEHERKRGRYEGSRGRYGARGTPDRSDWDNSRWEWEDTPYRNSRPGSSSSSRRHRPSPSPMLLGASPDVRLVSPWLGGHSSYSSAAASPWDSVPPSPVPKRASGSSLKSSNSRYGSRPQMTENSQQSKAQEETDADYISNDSNQEIMENMRLEMAYNADRAWYDREEGNTMFQEDS